MLNSSDNSVLISIVMPSLNQVNFIERAIRSVLHDQVGAVELIIMDGGSADGTQDLLAGLSQEDGRLRWVSQPDSGVAHAVNKALSLVNGEYVGWLNADDVYTHGAINRSIQALEANPQWMMVYGRGQHIDESGLRIDMYPTKKPAVGLTEFAKGCFICQPTVLLRRSALAELGPLDENLKAAFDLEWWMRIFKRYPDRIGFVDEIQAQSRLHEAGITFSQREAVISESMHIISRYLGACPLHWFKTYATEQIISYGPHEVTPELSERLENFANQIALYLTDEDNRKMRLWLKGELANINKTLGVSSKIISEIGKISASFRWLANKDKLSVKEYQLIQKQIELIKSSGIFDEAWYLSHYRDVERAGADPVEHYLLYGAKEGRNPSSLFNSMQYVERYPEIARTGINPLIHFLTYGRSDANRTNH